MLPNLVCTSVGPIVQIYQSWIDFMYSLVSFLGLTVPNARTTFGALLGCTF